MSASPILMPKLGLTMTEGLLAEWLVEPGSTVKAGDIMFVVETDKISTEVEARAEGRIEELRVAVGETVPVGAVVATWTGPAQGEDVGDGEVDPPQNGEVADPQGLTEGAASVAEPPPPSSGWSRCGPATPAAPPGGGGPEVRTIATPYARKLAREAGIAVDALRGSGPGGRIKAGDVTAYLAQPKPEPAATPALAVISFTAMAEADLTALESLRQRIAGEADEDIPVSRFVARAVAIAAPDVTFTDLTAGTTAWLLPSLAPGETAHIAIGAVRREFRPDENGNPVARSIAALTIAGDPAQLSAEDGIALLEAVADALSRPLKLLL